MMIESLWYLCRCHITTLEIMDLISSTCLRAFSFLHEFCTSPCWLRHLQWWIQGVPPADEPPNGLNSFVFTCVFAKKHLCRRSVPLLQWKILALPLTWQVVNLTFCEYHNSWHQCRTWHECSFSAAVQVLVGLLRLLNTLVLVKSNLL